MRIRTITFSDDVSVRETLARARMGCTRSRQRSVDDYFLEEIRLRGQLQLRRKRTHCAEREATGRGFREHSLRGKSSRIRRATLRWEKLAVPLHISVDVESRCFCEASGTNWRGFTWGGYDEAAQWCLGQQLQPEEALSGKRLRSRMKRRFENLEPNHDARRNPLRRFPVRRQGHSDSPWLRYALESVLVIPLFVHNREARFGFQILKRFHSGSKSLPTLVLLPGCSCCPGTIAPLVVPPHVNPPTPRNSFLTLRRNNGFHVHGI